MNTEPFDIFFDAEDGKFTFELSDWDEDELAYVTYRFIEASYVIKDTIIKSRQQQDEEEPGGGIQEKFQ